MHILRPPDVDDDDDDGECLMQASFFVNLKTNEMKIYLPK